MVIFYIGNTPDGVVLRFRLFLTVSTIVKISKYQKHGYINNWCDCKWDLRHKKLKDSLKGSLDRLLFAPELEFLKILVPRLPQKTSDVNIEWARKLKTTVSFMWLASWNTDVFILLFWC